VGNGPPSNRHRVLGSCLRADRYGCESLPDVVACSHPECPRAYLAGATLTAWVSGADWDQLSTGKTYSAIVFSDNPLWRSISASHFKRTCNTYLFPRRGHALYLQLCTGLHHQPSHLTRNIPDMTRRVARPAVLQSRLPRLGACSAFFDADMRGSSGFCHWSP
jgi:hypothetical protein